MIVCFFACFSVLKNGSKDFPEISYFVVFWCEKFIDQSLISGKIFRFFSPLFTRCSDLLISIYGVEISFLGHRSRPRLRKNLHFWVLNPYFSKFLDFLWVSTYGVKILSIGFFWSLLKVKIMKGQRPQSPFCLWSAFCSNKR